jgi:hypothetical protein
MATTTNYGWDTPDDTDLVKDGAAAIRTLGSSIDTTTKNLNPQTTTGAIAYRSATANVNTALPIGTANQVLRVNSGGTAPEWATSADQTPLTTKGDLFGFDTADARIPIGTDGHILTADSAQSLGLKWAAPGGFTFAAYTPSYTNITIGNGTVVARYGQSGKFVLVNWDWTWGSTSSISGSQPKVSLPVTAANTSGLGTAYFLDAGTLEQFGIAVIKSTGDFQMILPQHGSYGAGEPSARFHWTWTTSDRIKVSICYEAA